MKRVALILLISLMACSVKDDTKHYKFSNSDYNFIPTVYSEEGQVFTYRNQLNEEVQVEVSYYNKTRESGGGLSFSQGYQGELFYYEVLSIGLRFLEANVEGFPDGYCNTFQIRISKTAFETIFYKVSIPSYENNTCYGNGFNFGSPFEDLQLFEINDNVFGNVRVFHTNRAPNFYEDSAIDIVYFDLKNGILGFDDTTNNLQYRLVLD